MAVISQIFTLKNPEVINHTYTFNAPGLLGMNGTILNLLGLENIHSSKVSDIIAKDGINFTNAAGLNVGEEIKISGDSHSIKDMTEILYFYDLAIKKGSNENQITNYLSGFYKNNSTIFKSNGVVNIASKTLKEFNNIIGLSNTDINSIIDTCIVLENKNFHLNLLTPNSSIASIFSSSKLSTPALYALVNLNPFIVSGINSNAYDDIEKFKDEYSSEYIKDKVKMFESALDSKKNLGIYFNDIETGITIDQTTDFNGYFDEYHFGTNSNDL